MTQTKQTAIVGLGNSGCKIINQLTLNKLPDTVKLFAFDTDEVVLENVNLDKRQKILVDKQWRNGRGTGGNVVNGQRSLARERKHIEELIKDHELLIVIGGFGGGIATGGAPTFASVARQLSIKSVFLMTTPFAFEGHAKSQIADDGIAELLPVADILLSLPNDLLFNCLPGDTPIEAAFNMATQATASVVVGLYEALCPNNLLTADFTNLKEIITKKKGICSIGVGSARTSEGLNRCHLALERLLDSPLLGGVEKLNKANAILVSLTGGTNLTLSETRSILDAFKGLLDDSVQLTVGVNIAESFGETVQITAITVNFETTTSSDLAHTHNQSFGVESIIAPVSDNIETASNKTWQQAELPLQDISRGIFLNTTPVNMNGEDLDIPTFQRQSVKIDPGC